MRAFHPVAVTVAFTIAFAAFATTPSSALETVEPAIAVGAAGASGKGQAACTTADLANSNGHVVGAPRVHIILWGFKTFGDASSEATAAQNAFGTATTPGSGIQNTPFWQGSAWQYGDSDLAPGLAGFTSYAMSEPRVDITYDDTGLSAGACSLTETQIQSEVTYVNTHAVYPDGYQDPDDLVVVALPTCGTDNGPGKHYFDRAHGWAWVYVPYHPANPQNFVKTISHEVIEAATNPYSLQVVGNGAYLPPVAGENGWEQPGTSCEIGDLCEQEEFGVQTQSLASVASLNAQTTMQTLWSNELHDCVFSRSAYAKMVGLGTNRQIYVEGIRASTPSDFAPGSFSEVAPPSGAAPFVGKPTAAAWAATNLEIAALDENGTLWAAVSQDQGLSFQWAALPLASDDVTLRWFVRTDLGISVPDAASTGVGNFQVYAWAEERFLNQRASTLLLRDAFDWGGPWTGWQEIAAPVPPLSKISAASPMATNTGLTGGEIPVFLAYVDANHELELGVLTGKSTQPAWNAITLPISAAPVSVDLAMWNPRRYDAIVLDANGSLWDCGANANLYATVQCTLAGTTPTGGFVGAPGVASLGDGRLLMAGQVGGAGANAAFLRFLAAGQATAWNGLGSNHAPNGTLMAGVDVVAY